MQEIFDVGDSLVGELHDQNHARMKDGNVSIVALELGDGSAVGISDGVEGLASFNLVMNDGGVGFAGWPG